MTDPKPPVSRDTVAALVAALRGLMAAYGGQRTGQGGAYCTDEERVMQDARAALVKAGESPKIGREAFARAALAKVQP